MHALLEATKNWSPVNIWKSLVIIQLVYLVILTIRLDWVLTCGGQHMQLTGKSFVMSSSIKLFKMLSSATALHSKVADILKDFQMTIGIS
jgi:hypothetical protein